MRSLVPGVRVLSYSETANPAAHRASRRAGFDAHLALPLEPAEVERELGLLARTSLAGRALAFVEGLSGAARRAEALSAVLTATSTTRIAERMAEQTLDLAFDWFGGHAWAILASDETREHTWLAERGVSAGQRQRVGRLAGQAGESGRIVWTPGHGSAGRSQPAALALPMRSHGSAVAVLVGLDTGSASEPGPLPARSGQADRSESSDPSDPFAHLAALRPLLDAVGGAIDVALRLKRANTLSSVDDLTGLFNSRYLSTVMTREAKRAVRTGRPLSLLFVDLDGFKGINDRYGHLSGSRALVEAASRILSGARETDIVARFGGDEFALVLPETGSDGATLVARRVRDRVAGRPFLATEGINYRLTASVGVATLPDAASTPEELLAAADTAMYRVKARGKDGIEVADPRGAVPRLER